ncbi:hypothetical protein CYFUS_008643 [Cystobacter fuscus]|uniref:Inclusion body protein n=1 Tax=Cystobacter fuscus TaxID=43 RepID=A0A250JHQ4_9BACT|nr:AidA/PixA family protein [Cystobacter fuscus]ATB43163.1 hypothetical protein CYFUS_008643 [Cystobacter fuscus]
MSSTDPFIDILTVIDAKSLLKDYASKPGTKGSPTNLGGNASKYVYMLVKRGEANNMEAQDELSVAVKTSDTIRWRAASLTLNTGPSTLLYQMNVSAGGNDITTPAPYEAAIKIPTPVINGNNVTSIGSQPYKDFYFQSTARYPGQVTYQLYFMLVDDQGNPVGYFYWDPFLTITQS